MVIEYRVLGPLEVLVDGVLIVLPAGRGPDLLTLLLLRANHFVSTEELRDRLWGDEPSSKRNLHMAVNRLRQALGTADCVKSHTGGYEAVVEPGQLDLLEFRRLVDEGDFHAATALWRGPAGLDDAEREALEEERLVALERRIDADLAAGVTTSLVPELTELTKAHPAREAFWAQLIDVLQRDGRQADAEAVYREIEQLLADELGVEPGPRLRHVLAKPPRQLPAVPPHFVGRGDELALLGDGLGGRVVVISAIDGAGGVGKTALAVRWAHQVAGRFPGGQLFADMRGFDPAGEPADTFGVMRTFLLALGVPAAGLPQHPDQLTATYREVLTGRRVLLLLDNARDAGQVEPLLPADASSLALVTSRNRIDLGARLTLDVLGPDEAMALFRARVGDALVAAEPRAASRLVELCGGLPLAIGVVAARAVLDGKRLTDLVPELESARLDVLETDDAATSLRAVFSWSLARLDAESLRTFLLIGLHPGPDITEEVIASLAGRPVDVHTLVEHSLLVERVPGRFVQHDLLREYAAEQVTRTGEAAEAMRRMLDHYVHAGVDGLRVTAPLMPVVDLEPAAPGVVPRTFRDAAESIEWLTAEWEVLSALLQVAKDTGHDSHLWRLALAIRPRLLHRAAFREGVRTYRMAVAAAQRSGELPGEVKARRQLSLFLVNTGEFDEATAEAQRAIALDDQLGDDVGASCDLRLLANVHVMKDDCRSALPPAREALRRAEKAGDVVEQANSNSFLAVIHGDMNEHEEAVAHGECALATFLEILGDKPDTICANAKHMLAVSYRELGRLDEAAEQFRTTIAMWQVLGNPYNAADLHFEWGRMELRRGNPAEARGLLTDALRFFDEVGDERMGEAKALLEQVD